MRGELVNDGIRLMGVYPGPIDTDLARGIDMENNTPDNVATAVVQGLRAGTQDMFPDAHVFTGGAELHAGFKGSSQHVLAGVRVAVR